MKLRTLALLLVFCLLLGSVPALANVNWDDDWKDKVIAKAEEVKRKWLKRKALKV